MAEFLVALFDASITGAARSDSITARQLLDRGAGRIEHDLQDQPEVRATLMDTIGRAYGNLRFFDRAIPLFEEALQTRRRLLGEDDPLVAVSLGNLAMALHGAGEYEASQRAYQAALELRHRLDGASSLEIADLLHGRGRLQVARGELEAAARDARLAVEMRRQLLGDQHVRTAQSQILLAECLRAISTLQQTVGEPHLFMAQARHGLGALLADRGDFAAAERLLRQSLAITEPLLGNRHWRVADTKSEIAGC